ncbi:hypothetical protein JCM19046_3039 [Bacillus sp. JCM 19046]|nr:hypothetical protein JCM19046_3039 [Bacillus sp. JCM 19046]
MRYLREEVYRIYNDMSTCIKEIREKNIRAISINEAFYSGSTLEFLKEIPSVTKLHIVSSKLMDFSALHYLPQLEQLLLDVDLKQPFDLTGLSLKKLALNWSKDVRGIETLVHLEELRLSQYKPASYTLSELKALSKLSVLELTGGSIRSLMGLDQFIHLRHLSLSLIKTLRTLSLTKEENQNVSEVWIEGCNNIEDLSDLHQLSEVRKLVLTQVGQVPSIQFITKMKQLTYFAFLESEIVDGDLTPCLGVNDVQFDEKAWYSHSNASFRKANGHVKAEKQRARRRV